MPTVVFTSSGLEQDIALAYRLGANAYFVKPSSFDEIKAMLRTICEFWTQSSKPVKLDRYK